MFSKAAVSTPDTVLRGRSQFQDARSLSDHTSLFEYPGRKRLAASPGSAPELGAETDAGVAADPRHEELTYYLSDGTCLCTSTAFFLHQVV